MARKNDTPQKAAIRDLAMIDITKKWTGYRQDWGQIHSELETFFEERLS